MATDSSRAPSGGVLSPYPLFVAYLVAGLIALAFSYDLMRIPVQVSDSLLEILGAQRSRSTWASFTDQLGGAAYFRPLRIAQIKLLFDLADGHYWVQPLHAPGRRNLHRTSDQGGSDDRAR